MIRDMKGDGFGQSRSERLDEAHELFGSGSGGSFSTDRDWGIRSDVDVAGRSKSQSVRLIERSDRTIPTH